MKRLYALVARFATVVAFPLTALILHNSRRVRVILLAGDSILLQRTSVGTQKWSLPGGGVERHEEDKIAAAREVAEEVGITLGPDQLVHIGEDYRAAAGHKKWPRFTRVYLLVELAQKVQPEIINPLEILEAKWFPIDNLPDVDKPTLDSALSFLAAHKR